MNLRGASVWFVMMVACGGGSNPCPEGRDRLYSDRAGYSECGARCNVDSDCASGSACSCYANDDSGVCVSLSSEFAQKSAVMADALRQCNAGPIPDGFARFAGTLHEMDETPISEASVFLPFGTNSAWGAKTNAQGTFRFDAKVADFEGVSPVAMTASKPGYRPQTFFYSELKAGARYTLSQTSSAAVVPLAAGEYAPDSANRLWHLGDDNFTGSTNSKLQTGTFGLGLSFPVTTMSAGDRTAVIELIARGIDQNCADAFGVLAEAPGGQLRKSATPGPSATSGDFSRYRFTLDVSTFPAGSQVKFFSLSGTCGGTDHDDFEFTEIFVKLSP